MAGKPTINDIAAAANVSIATVSRVLNNSDCVKEGTKQKVYQAMQKIGYYSPVLQSLQPELNQYQNQGKELILIILPGLKNPFYATLVDGINASAEYMGYDTIIYKQKESVYRFEQMKELAERLAVRGIVFAGPGAIGSVETLTRLNQIIPIVQCSGFDTTSDLPIVSTDDYEAGKTATRYLIERGRKRIAFLNGSLNFKYEQNREKGYRDALAEAGLKVEESLIVNLADILFEPALAMMTQILSQANRPDAVFAVSDILGIAAVKAARSVGLRVPEDVAVIGFDNSYLAPMCEPALTSMNNSAYQIGFLACKMLIDRLNHVYQTQNQVKLASDLIIRLST